MSRERLQAGAMTTQRYGGAWRVLCSTTLVDRLALFQRCRICYGAAACLPARHCFMARRAQLLPRCRQAAERYGFHYNLIDILRILMYRSVLYLYSLSARILYLYVTPSFDVVRTYTRTVAVICCPSFGCLVRTVQ